MKRTTLYDINTKALIMVINIHKNNDPVRILKAMTNEQRRLIKSNTKYL